MSYLVFGGKPLPDFQLVVASLTSLNKNLITGYIKRQSYYFKLPSSCQDYDSPQLRSILLNSDYANPVD